MSLPLDKIRKLLRLSKSPNEHEAALAMEKAFEIAALNDIDLDTVDLGDDLNQIVHDNHHVGSRLSLSRKLALAVVRNFFNVTPLISYPNVVFVGRRCDIEIAEYVFDFLARTCDRCACKQKREWGRRFTENRRRNFVAGFFYGINSNLKKSAVAVLEAHPCHAVALRDQEQRRKEYLADLYSNTQTVKLSPAYRRDPDFMTMGFLDGKATTIKPPVSGTRQVAGLLAGNKEAHEGRI